jgi:hypothetical protein
MVGIAEEPPRQLVPSVESATLDFVIRAGSVKFIINIIQIASGEQCSSIWQIRSSVSSDLAFRHLLHHVMISAKAVSSGSYQKKRRAKENCLRSNWKHAPTGITKDAH